jgi:hypothetical protein
VFWENRMHGISNPCQLQEADPMQGFFWYTFTFPYDKPPIFRVFMSSMREYQESNFVNMIATYFFCPESEIARPR